MSEFTIIAAPLLGIVAGALTTTTGFGGGLFLIVIFLHFMPPATALAMSSLALLAGNAHRSWLLRRSVDGPVLRPYAFGVAAGSIAGALVATALPAWLMKLFIALGVALALARAVGWLHLRAQARSLFPAGAGIGVMAATTGGAGLLQGPLFMACGLTGPSFVATMSAAALVSHIGRMIGYGSGGIYSIQLVMGAGFLASGILLGNVVGAHLARGLSPAMRRRAELGTLLVCAALSLAGFV